MICFCFLLFFVFVFFFFLLGELFARNTHNPKILFYTSDTSRSIPDTSDLFGTVWMTLCNRCDLQMNSFCNKVNLSPLQHNKLEKKEFKEESLEIFSGLSKCNKTKVKFQVEVLNRSVPYAAVDSINQELDRLERIGVISKNSNGLHIWFI